jgi:hypothetical protein
MNGRPWRFGIPKNLQCHPQNSKLLLFIVRLSQDMAEGEFHG